MLNKLYVGMDLDKGGRGRIFFLLSLPMHIFDIFTLSQDRNQSYLRGLMRVWDLVELDALRGPLGLGEDTVCSPLSTSRLSAIDSIKEVKPANLWVQEKMFSFHYREFSCLTMLSVLMRKVDSIKDINKRIHCKLKTLKKTYITFYWFGQTCTKAIWSISKNVYSKWPHRLLKLSNFWL